jgi:hypothetical protein
LGATALHFLRAQVLQTTVLLALPVVKSFTRGRPIHWWVVVAGAMFCGRAVLWLSTDMVWVHATLHDIPRDPARGLRRRLRRRGRRRHTEDRGETVGWWRFVATARHTGTL